MSEYVIIRVKFENTVTQEQIDEITAQFYLSNEKQIRGMTADTLKNENAWKRFNKIYKEFIDEKEGGQDE